jgi:hypothetical protein
LNLNFVIFVAFVVSPFLFWLRLGRAGRYGETLLCIAGYRAG